MALRPLDPSIVNFYQPPKFNMPDPMQDLAQFSQIINAQNQNALAQYSLAAARRGEETENALNKAYMEAYNLQTGQIDLPTLRGKIATAGVGSKLPAIEKQLAEVEKEQLARKEQLGKVINQRLEQSKSLLPNIKTNEQFIAWQKANYADPILGQFLADRGITAESSLAQIMADLAQPGGLERSIARSITALDKMPELLRSEQEQAVLGGRAPTQPMAAPATNALAPSAPQAQPIANAMVAPVQTAAAPPPAVAAMPSFAMPATSGLQGELSAVNNEIARLQGSGNAGLPGVQARIKALEDQKAKLFTAINQEAQLNKPIVTNVDVGNQVVTQSIDPVTKQVTILETRNKGASPQGMPSDVQSYEYAKNQGYTGTYTQWVKDKATWGRAPAQPPAPAPLQQAFDTQTNSQVFVDRADIRANPDRYKPVGAEEKLKNIPETINKALTGNVSSISQIDKAIDAATKNPTAIGLKGNLPQAILNRADPQGVDTRALITEIGSAIVHDRSGAAVAASERPTLVPFIPQATDDSETAIKKLKQLKAKIQAEQSGILDFYSQEQGYKPSLYHKKQDVPAEPAAPAAAKPAAADIGSLPPKVTKDGATYVLQPNGKYIKQ
jgi:hypothetical protein